MIHLKNGTVHIPHTNSVEQLTDAQNRKGVGLRLSQHRGNPQPFYDIM